MATSPSRLDSPTFEPAPRWLTTPAAGAAVSFAPAGAEVACAHCGLPVPSRLLQSGREHQFCCSGCESVFQIIHESGLDDYYRFRGDAADAPQAKTTDRTYRELDDPAFAETHCRELPGGLLATELVLEGIHCAACVWLVEKIAVSRAGAVEARLDLADHVLRVTWDPSQAPLSSIARTLDSFGYPVFPRHGVRREEVERREDRALLVRVGVAGAAAGNAMMMAVALYTGDAWGMAPELTALFRWASMAVTVPSVAWSGSVFFRGAWAALRARTPHVDLPLSIGILAGTIGGSVNTIRGAGEIYFDSIAALIFLLLVGRYLQRRRQRAAHGAADLVRALAPSTARIVEGSGTREVSAMDVPTGALVEVRAGERIPVDGAVSEGRSTVDNSLLTGESMPELVSPGHLVHAGTTNLGSRIVVCADRTGFSTRVAELVSKMEEAARARAPVVALADRVARVFVVVVLLIAAVTFAAWAAAGSELALDYTIALLVVTCPCALGLATPLTMSAALGEAARSGILVKGGSAVEALAEPGLVVFDKTGTLTRGVLTLETVEGDQSLLPLVGAVEQHSVHPIARALRELARDGGEPVTGFEETIGGGVSGRVLNTRVVVGTLAYVGNVCDVPDWVESAAGQVGKQARTPVVAASDDGRFAVLGLGDPIRPEAPACLRTLRQIGHRLAVLSGDRTEVVEAVADRLGVRLDVVRGGVTPEEKLEAIRAAARRGPVFMVGDGVNDAAALSAATAGIAVHGGAEASLAAADVFTTKSGLEPVVRTFRGARRALSVLRMNLRVSLIYNLIAGSLAVSGLIGPLLAAVLMPLSSITVITLSYRLRTFGVRK